jgi:hypothetical protein
MQNIYHILLKIKPYNLCLNTETHFLSIELNLKNNKIKRGITYN